MTEAEIKKIVRAEIKKVKRRIVKSPVAQKEAEIGAARVLAAIDAEDKPALDALLADPHTHACLARSSDESLLAGLRETLQKDLMYCSRSYVVTDAPRLLSPAGFHPDDRVFVVPSIAIHTDHPEEVGDIGRPLYAHKVA